jgi:hypothetical protein
VVAQVPPVSCVSPEKRFHYRQAVDIDFDKNNDESDNINYQDIVFQPLKVPMIKTTTMTPTKKPKNDKYDIEVLHVSCG